VTYLSLHIEHLYLINTYNYLIINWPLII